MNEAIKMINRRQFLKITGAGAVGVFTGAMSSLKFFCFPEILPEYGVST